MRNCDLDPEDEDFPCVERCGNRVPTEDDQCYPCGKADYDYDDQYEDRCGDFD